jgi:hypothetical protein
MCLLEAPDSSAEFHRLLEEAMQVGAHHLFQPL